MKYEHFLTYSYVSTGTETNITVRADKGSSVTVKIFYADGNSDNRTLPLGTVFPPEGILFKHTYAATGSYQVNAYLDNVISNANITGVIKVLDVLGTYSCKPLEPFYETNEKVLFQFTRQTGQQAAVTNISIFWGDGTSWETLTDFATSVIYNHTYTAPGKYNVTTRLDNPIPSVAHCSVYVGIQIPVGPLTCDFKPRHVITGQKLSVNVSVPQGTKINLTYTENGAENAAVPMQTDLGEFLIFV